MRACTEDGAAFVVERVDDADWLRLIGDVSFARPGLL